MVMMGASFCSDCRLIFLKTKKKYEWVRNERVPGPDEVLSLCMLMLIFQTSHNPMIVIAAPSHCKPCAQMCCSSSHMSTLSVRAGVLLGHGVGSAGLHNMQRRVIWINVMRNRLILNA